MRQTTEGARGGVPRGYRRSLVSAGVACALAAAGALAVSPVDARITRIEITTTESPTFGGYCVAGRRPVREARRHGLRRARPDESARTPSSSTCSSRRGMPAARSNTRTRFYILKPIDLAKGATRSCTSRPTAAARRSAGFNRVRRRQRSRARSPMPPTLANTFLMPRGYTHRVERLGLLGGHEHGQLQLDDHAARREESRRLVDHRAGVRVHRDGQRDDARRSR